MKQVILRIIMSYFLMKFHRIRREMLSSSLKPCEQDQLG